MPPPQNRERDATADATRAAILRYLDQHEGALDTVDGIADWWLPNTHPRAEPDEVQLVLDVMTGAGELEQIHAAGRCYYRRPL